MNKFLLSCIILWFMLCISLFFNGCSAQTNQRVQTVYGIGKTTVKTFVSADKKEEYSLKELDAIFTNSYNLIIKEKAQNER